MNKYKVTYKSGLKGDLVVEAETAEDAAQIANAEYRKNAGFVEMVIETPIDKVIDTVELIA